MKLEEKLREIINSKSEYYPSEDKAVFEKYFPELKESDDERIKQCLIEHIKCNKDLNWSLFQWFKPDTIISWLEKQKSSNTPSRETILAIWELGNDWKELANGSISTEHGTQLEYIQKHWQESSYYDNIMEGNERK